MLLLKNGYMLDPASQTEGYRDILIDTESGTIRKIAPQGTPVSEMLCGAGDEAAETKRRQLTEIDLNGQYIVPGLVDVHVHFRDPGFTHKEDIYTGAAAAAKGGFTSVVLMANTKPAVDNPETLSYVLDRGKETGIHIYTCANVTKGLQGRELTDMELLSACGAAGFTDDGIPLTDEGILREALKKAAKCGKPVSLHEEDPALITNNGVHAGKAAAHYGIGGSPREAEIAMVERDLRIALEEEADLSIQHISTKEAVELVRQAKKKSRHIFAEATPHHFTLTEEAVIRCGTLAKMNPPLREEADRLAIIEGLRDGTIDMIATDHAPHSAQEKAKPLTEAPSGIIGLETALSLGIRELVSKGYLSVMELIEKMSLAPARLYHLDAGYLKEGGPADLTVFDPGKEWTVERFVSKAANSPFIGERLPGVVGLTVCGGKIV
ncbi:MAG: dihydroorotase [Bacteroidales bacterium]|nr:dihydroorotase [Bacteroidales bacterium]MCM1416218.1 dihydroorotase [bacterium]MCM1424230.1 dihydroorotase [bacterium]